MRTLRQKQAEPLVYATADNRGLSWGEKPSKADPGDHVLSSDIFLLLPNSAIIREEK